VAALIATVAFAAAITVPGGLKSEKGSEQGTPFFIDEAAFKAFVVTNTLAFLFSVSALTTHFGVLDNLLLQFKFFRQTVLYRTRSVSGILGYATLAMVIAFSTGSLTPSLPPLHQNDKGSPSLLSVGRAPMPAKRTKKDNNSRETAQQKQ
ncbi:hypothetical protein Gotur_023868, partial [Gossypium turneri]